MRYNIFTQSSRITLIFLRLHNSIYIRAARFSSFFLSELSAEEGLEKRRWVKHLDITHRIIFIIIPMQRSGCFVIGRGWGRKKRISDWYFPSWQSRYPGCTISIYVCAASCLLARKFASLHICLRTPKRRTRARDKTFPLAFSACIGKTKC